MIPADLPVAPLDLCIIMGNLVTNAIEACEQLPVEARHVSVHVQVKQEHLVIKIINNKQSVVQVTEAMLQAGYSHKKGGEKNRSGDHGLGLFSVRQIIQRHEGILKIEDQGSQFAVHAAIPLVNVDH